MADYRRIKEYSKNDASQRAGIREALDHQPLKMACITVAIERYREKFKIDDTDDINLSDPVEASHKVMLKRQQMMLVKAFASINEQSYFDFEGRGVNGRMTNEERLEKWKQVVEQRKKLGRKIGLAIFSGLMLVVPMLIMILHPTLLTVTITTSVFVLVVGVLLAALMKEAEPKDIVAATAAYAAVLVVFVAGSEGSGATSVGFPNNSSMTNAQVGVIVAGSILVTIMVMILTVVLWIFIALKFPSIRSPIRGMIPEGFYLPGI